MATLITSNNTDRIPPHPINNDLRNTLPLLPVALGIQAATLPPNKLVARIKAMRLLPKEDKSLHKGKRASQRSPAQIL